MKKVYRVLFAVSVITIFFIFHKLDCVKLRFSSVPQIIIQYNFSETVVLRSAQGICMDCPPSRFLQRISTNPDMLYIVPSDFTNFDIENMQDVFQLAGKVIRGDSEVSAYIDKIAGCYGKRKGAINIIFQFDDNKNVINIQGF